MNQLEDAKKRYDGFRSGRKQYYKWGLGTAAAFLVTFTAALNTNTAFAEEVQQLPVVGVIARVMTVNSYTKTVGDEQVSVEVPGVEFIESDTLGLPGQINEEIQEICKKYADESLERAKEYKEAFLSTGGTEAEWAEHKIEIKVWYEIKAQSDAYLSFVVRGTESWTSAYSQDKYYNIDLKSGKLLSLKDALGEDYINKANESIKSQMEEKSSEIGIPFFTSEEGGFESISDETKFYMKDNGNPVIVFDKYEIAPGAAGAVEFEIKR